MKRLNKKQLEWFHKRIQLAGFAPQSDGTLTRRLMLPHSGQHLEAVLTHLAGGPVLNLNHPVRLVLRRLDAPQEVTSDQQHLCFGVADAFLTEMERAESRQKAEEDLRRRWRR